MRAASNPPILSRATQAGRGRNHVLLDGDVLAEWGKPFIHFG
jgi:hypothetical protein